jgi:hypothetical protein
MPAIILPQIIAFIFGAAPQRALPTSKVMRLLMMRVLVLKRPLQTPTSRITDTEPIGKPIPTHGSFSISPSETRIGPWTSADMVVSRPI